MSSRTSKSQAAQQQQQQSGSINAPPTIRSMTSASRVRMGNGPGAHFPGPQGGVARTEPPRSMPAFSASSIRPSESASNVSTQLSATSRTRSRAGGSRSSSIRPTSVPSYQYSPPAAPYVPAGRFGAPGPYMVPMGSNVQPSPASFAQIQQRSARSNAESSTARVPPPVPSATSQQSSGRSNAALSTTRAPGTYVSGAQQTTSSNVVPRAIGGVLSQASRQNYAGGWVGAPQPAGINIGASPYGPVNLHYNQVDNRQLTIHNNAPGKVTSTNNNITKVDKSHHHNSHAPQTNTYHTNLTNVGNSHTNLKQKAASAKASTAKGSTARMYRAE